ncbi:hypothetical protein EVG20_g1177 [Dentipellis fragilis]|uniref:Mediator of RNA polymerase II transcription subunit 11 n=1 Tax=Dentipellis fragilis TaxID=205917 RepID=A0A4Y9ZDJ3_9AGAM|nr:hypothetical protein EVG20_g1177 [Dentipellis fragilis]
MATDDNSQVPPSQNGSNDGGLDPIWSSSRTARQIYALGEVEKDIGRLLSLAASSISLLTLPQTDAPEDGLPQGGERDERFVEEVSEYFERLDNIQIAMRSSLAHIRQSRIAPSAIDAPPPGFVPSALGVGLPPAVPTHTSSSSASGSAGPGDAHARVPRPKTRGLQEERVERDAWKGMLQALTKLKDARARERQEQEQQQQADAAMQE